ncbi:hypothetical protein T07_1669 [Trichinella nelsoni]|uniref:Uncharacterized protein n=1 Tax=Trichinella nelsoni TaxID=6336 RepID=A0A0V0RD00_9BILA|nr:hypothetical protein T07_1669 [Trichinella nelsoni]
MRFSDEKKPRMTFHHCFQSKRMYNCAFWSVHFVRVHKPPYQPSVEYEQADIFMEEQ